MKLPAHINPSVRSLLLDANFITLVFGPPLQYSGAATTSLEQYTNEDIETARDILLHLDDYTSCFTDDDLLELKKRIKANLNTGK